MKSQWNLVDNSTLFVIMSVFHCYGIYTVREILCISSTEHFVSMTPLIDTQLHFRLCLSRLLKQKQKNKYRDHFCFVLISTPKTNYTQIRDAIMKLRQGKIIWYYYICKKLGHLISTPTNAHT